MTVFFADEQTAPSIYCACLNGEAGERHSVNQTRQDNIQSFAFLISACVAIGLCGGFVSSPQDGDCGRGRCRVRELETRINPNDAPIESLARLPGLGPGRAAAIVAYRESRRESPAFRDSRDLQNVSGIGPVTVERIDNWIEFE